MGKIHIANAADWGLDQAVLTEYSGKWQGAVFEGCWAARTPSKGMPAGAR